MKNSILCYLEETVKKFPNRIALTDATGDYTFVQWKKYALCIAEAIQKKTEKRQIPVFVYLPKSAMTLFSFAGVLYSGNYYTPTDVKFPFHKPKSIMDCLHPEVIITNLEYGKKLTENGVCEDKMIYVDELDFDKEQEDSDKFLKCCIDTDLAYVFFTSGSTGVPKGVSIMHKSVIDYIDWAGECFGITEQTRIANQAPFYFDNSILDIYLCMSKGAHLFITPEMHFAFPARLLQYLQENEINFIFWVPSALMAVANSGLLEKIDCSCLEKVLFCGEVMPNKQLNEWRRVLPDVLYANLYGPTEITDACTYFIVNREFSDQEPLPIGYACKNTQILLLDDKDCLIKEKGQMGELCVRGTGVSVGYYNNPEKTKENFVQNPLNPHYPEIIYRTGDLAHYNEFGEIMFDGRKDFQIKHMGYRIELGEIETAILSINEISNACCIYDTEKMEIVAFYQVKEDCNPEEVNVRKKLMSVLPKYMVPTKYNRLEAMPYNDNGKINRRQLKEEYMKQQ